MPTLTLHSHVGPDGLLQLKLPEKLKDQDVTVTIQSDAPEWLAVLQRTAVSIPDLERPPQGEYEVRDPL